MLDDVSKKFPGPNCGWQIQTTEGCAYVTCSKCRYEFCWECRASHEEIDRVGNTAHARACKFHTANLDGTTSYLCPVQSDKCQYCPMLADVTN